MLRENGGGETLNRMERWPLSDNLQDEKKSDLKSGREPLSGWDSECANPRAGERGMHLGAPWSSTWAWRAWGPGAVTERPSVLSSIWPAYMVLKRNLDFPPSAVESSRGLSLGERVWKMLSEPVLIFRCLAFEAVNISYANICSLSLCSVFFFWTIWM